VVPSDSRSSIPARSKALAGLRTALSATLKQIYRARLAYLFLAPAYILILTFIAYPLVRSLYLSLFEWNGITKPSFIGLENFVMLFQDHSFLNALYNTLAFSVLTTAGTVIIGFFLAVAIERRVVGWAAFKIIYFLPVMMAMTVVGLLWGQLLDPTFGPINVFLKALGVVKPPVWMGNPYVALYAIIAVSIWQYAGFPMIVFLAAMENINLDIHDAATIDGVNAWQRIANIIFPMIKNVIAVMVMLQIIFSLKVFDVVWVMTQGGPGEATTVMGVYLYRNAFIYTHFGYGSAIAVLMTAIVFTVSMLYRRYVKVEAIEY
jgi:multiple sugar transport system permease protein